MVILIEISEFDGKLCDLFCRVFCVHAREVCLEKKNLCVLVIREDGEDFVVFIENESDGGVDVDSDVGNCFRLFRGVAACRKRKNHRYGGSCR